MKLNFIATIVALLATATMAGQVNADATADARKGVEATMKKLDAAFNRKDAAGATAVLSPDFENIQPNGSKQNYAEVKQMFTQIVTIAKSIKVASTVKTLSLKGNLAVATVATRMELTGVNPQTGKPIKSVTEDTSTDTYVKKGSVWLFKESQTVKQKMTVDGKEVPVP